MFIQSKNLNGLVVNFLSRLFGRGTHGMAHGAFSRGNGRGGNRGHGGCGAARGGGVWGKRQQQLRVRQEAAVAAVRQEVLATAVRQEATAVRQEAAGTAVRQEAAATLVRQEVAGAAVRQEAAALRREAVAVEARGGGDCGAGRDGGGAYEPEAAPMNRRLPRKPGWPPAFV